MKDLIKVSLTSIINSKELVMCLRVIIALILSSLIGVQRKRAKGDLSIFRTHVLIGVGAALIGTIGILLSSEQTVDITRMSAQIISGIGFLGAGVIMKDGTTVSGLTTAASLWFVGCIGIGIGLGLYILSIFTTILILMFLIFFTDKIEERENSNLEEEEK